MYTKSQRLSLEAVMDRIEQSRRLVREELAFLAMAVLVAVCRILSRGFDESVAGEGMILTGSSLGEFEID